MRIAGIILRTLFIVTLIVLIARVSWPQSETIWSAYETPSDLVRITLGAGAILWAVVHLFTLPKDAEAYRTWVYVGSIAVPVALILAVVIW